MEAVAKESAATKGQTEEAPGKEDVTKDGPGKETAVAVVPADGDAGNDEKPDANRLGKRKREEETDDYLSFVERTMAAYKKL